MRLSIKGAFGKNQGFRAFTASHSDIFALCGQSLLRLTGNLPLKRYDRDFKGQFPYIRPRSLDIYHVRWMFLC